MMGVGGGSPLRTARAFVGAKVWTQLAGEWGELVWTAPDLALSEFHRRSESASIRLLFGLPA